MLNIFNASTIPPLVAQLTQDLNRQRVSPFNTACVVIQNAGMGKWLRQSIAAEAGIAANLDFPLLSRYVWDLVHRMTGLSIESPYSKSTISLAILDTLQRDSWPELSHYLESIDTDAALISFAEKIADTFDAYMFFRPD